MSNKHGWREGLNRNTYVVKELFINQVILFRIFPVPRGVGQKMTQDKKRGVVVWEGPKQNNIIHEQPRFLYVVRRLEDTLFVVRRCIVCKYKMFL